MPKPIYFQKMLSFISHFISDSIEFRLDPDCRFAVTNLIASSTNSISKHLKFHRIAFFSQGNLYSGETISIISDKLFKGYWF